MFFSIISGIIIGYVLAMPPGPVAVSAMDISLNKNKRSLMFYALGSGIIDIVLGLIAVVAADQVFDIFSKFGNRHFIIVCAIRILIVAAFIAYGIYCLLKNNNNNQNKSLIFLDNNTFLLGIGISATNFTNPTYIPSLVYIFLQIQELGIIADSFSGNLLFALAFGAGNFLWLFTLHTIILHNKHLLSEKGINVIKKMGGLVYIFCAGLLAYKFAIATNWTQISKLIHI